MYTICWRLLALSAKIFYTFGVLQSRSNFILYISDDLLVFEELESVR